MSKRFNLVDDATATILRPNGDPFPARKFSPPLAAPVPPAGRTDPRLETSGLPDAAVYAFTDRPEDDVANAVTRDYALVINIDPAVGGFPPDPDNPSLPPPAYRVHAITRGRLRFYAETAATPARLVLRTEMFSTLSLKGAPWWQRWVEAHCAPRDIIYEDIDIADLDAYLRALPVAGLNGLSFPESREPRDDAWRNLVVDAFFNGPLDAAGDPVTFLSVEPGGYIGQARALADEDGVRQLTLRVRYGDHTQASPHPMNPRELLYLIFGNSSRAAGGEPPHRMHPLLEALDTIPASVPRRTNTTLLRPPLRTWARLMWEADIEQAIDSKYPVTNPATSTSRRWTNPGILAADTLFDTRFRRDGARVTYAGIPAETNKCNIFTSDVCVRAGFRAMIVKIVPAAPAGAYWHYPRANSHTHAGVAVLQARAAEAAGRFEIMGVGADGERVWGYVLTKYLTTGAKTKDEINAMMSDEGRALIVAGARPSRANPTPPPARLEGVGHIVLLRTLTEDPETDPILKHDNPYVVTNNDPAVVAAGTPVGAVLMIHQIWMNTAQASGGKGAVSNEPYPARLGSAGGGASGPSGFIRLHLLEAASGRDPDLLQGLADLHVLGADTNQLATAID